MSNFNEKIVLKNNQWHWPAYDKNCFDYTVARSDVPQKIMKYVKNNNVCLHAGANAGYYAKQYSTLFKNVYVFEPESVNFLCLNLNCPEDNVYKFNCCLGDNNKLVKLIIDQIGGGSHNLGRDIESGNVPMLKIDNFNFGIVDLIHLDVEGAEVLVLNGAIETIKRCKPTIVAEFNWVDPSDFLINLNYKKVDNIDGDFVFTID